MDKLTVVYPDSRISCTEKMVYQAMERQRKPYIHITNWKKLIWKCYTLCECNNTVFWKRQNFGDNKRISGWQGWGGDDERAECRKILGAWNYSIRWCKGGTVITYSSKLIKCTTARLKNDANCGLWVTTMSQHKCINCSKCATTK